MSDENFAAARRADRLAALRVERDGCVQRGQADRVKLIDAEIAAYGGKVEGRATAKKATAKK